MSNFLKRPDIEKLVELSNERSSLKHRLSSGSKSPILRLQSSELQQRSDKFHNQIGAAASEVDKDALLPNRARYCLLISDADGIVIESYAPEGLEAEFQRSGLVEGAAWDERIAGTNGISLSMQTGRVVTVRGKDHFYNCFAEFACSTAPLTDAENNLIGTITLVGASNRRPEEIALCEQTLRRASRQFQTRLFRNFHSEKLTARLLSREPLTRRQFETLVACDEEGVVVSHLPLWRDPVKPEQHQNLVGRHIADLKQFEVSMRGPAAVPPRRRVVRHPQPRIPARIDKEAKLARIVTEGGGLSVLAERARRLVAHRVPILIAGESGTGAAEFARALLEDQELHTPMSLTLDATQDGSEAELKEALRSLQFLADYPIKKVTPTLILRNVDSLTVDAHLALHRYLISEDREKIDESNDQMPVLLFTSGKPWADLEADETIPRGMLYLMGQSVLELPPLRQRDLETVIDNIIGHDVGVPVEISDAAKDVLINYDWPGNLHEMRAVIREALICGNGRRINTTDLPERLSQPRETPGNPITPVTLREALDSTNWNVTKAALLLGKSRSTINRWIASEGLHRPD
jgi:transcriptional regulator of acetoin/glycerol metabolism